MISPVAARSMTLKLIPQMRLIAKPAFAARPSIATKRLFSMSSRWCMEPIPAYLDEARAPKATAESFESLYTLNDDPQPSATSGSIDWARAYNGLSSEPFSKEITGVLSEKLSPSDIEIKPDGIIYLPEIKYRRILNQAFGPGGWGLVPRGATLITSKTVTREYALVAHGRLISIARGEQDYFAPTGIPTATEGCKSNALMRCCKDLGVASELWDPSFIRTFKKDFCVNQFADHVLTKKRRKLWRRKDAEFDYPYKVSTF
ncbi:mitochondrial genome maintenance protein [Dipodascopsis tothii]|uniref:mitochondrial genome maintenance protein n=1 Tax=Dipodascopsis tothii TaxID=44089 RepID=UPI0034CE599E